MIDRPDSDVKRSAAAEGPADLDARWGRDVLRRALEATSEKEPLDLRGTTEDELLADWERRVRNA